MSEERPRGNIFYEIIIVILAIVLIGSIFYPSKIWKRESEEEQVCKTRMDAIQQLQLQYVVKTNKYLDSLDVLVDRIGGDPNSNLAIDSLIQWDKLVLKDELETLIMSRQLPGELRSHILQRLEDEKPIGNLGKWDSLQFVLIEDLKRTVQDLDGSSETILDENVLWPALTGEDRFYEIISSDKIPRQVQSRTILDVQRNSTPIQLTPGWKFCRPDFYSDLKQLIGQALRTDVYTPDQVDDWEIKTHQEYIDQMNALSQSEKDSIWTENQGRFWDNQKELIWKKDRKRLWNEEKDKWIPENESIWKRAVTQHWSAERRGKWQDEVVGTLPDSIQAMFPAQKDSLWRIVEDSLFNLEYPEWQKDNKKYIDEVTTTVWENDRRVTWEDGAKAKWLEGKASDWKSLWKNIAEDMWNANLPRLWRDEEVKLADKYMAIKRIDQALIWKKVLGQERVQQIVNGLTLPGNTETWKQVEGAIGEKVSAMYSLGLHGIFKKALLDSAISHCPVARQPYIINVIDTSAIARWGISCPIADTTALGDIGLALHLPSSAVDKGYAVIKIDPLTKDISFVDLKLPAVQKILGGASIKPHGYIDLDGKKSWDKTTR